MSNWYVDASVVSSGDGTTLGTAFKTITEGAAAAVAGDTVIVSGGTYNEQITLPRSGEFGNPITFRSATGETAIIDGQRTRARGFDGDNDSHLTFEGFEIKNTTLAGFYFNRSSDYITIRYCDVHNNLVHGIYIKGGDYPLIEYNRVYRNGEGGISISWYSNDQNFSMYPTVRRNLCYGNGAGDDPGSGDGISASGGRYGTIEENLCWYNTDDGIDVSADSGRSRVPYYNTVSKNCLWYNGYNIDTGLAENIGDGNGIKIATNAGGGHLISRNIAFLNSRAGFDRDDIDHDSPKDFYYNNVAYDNGNVVSTPIESVRAGFVFGGCLLSTRAATVKNNIGWGNATTYQTGSNARKDLHTLNFGIGNGDYNNWQDTDINDDYVIGDHSISGDPLFVNPDGVIDTTDPGTGIPDHWEFIYSQIIANFTLQAGSPCANAGMTVSGVTDDYAGVAPDMGAVEGQSVPTYYVSTTGNDSNDGLGPGNDHAWKTVQKAVISTSGGDYVYIMPGTYTENGGSGYLNLGYVKSGGVVTFQPYQSGTVNIQGTSGTTIQVDSNCAYQTWKNINFLAFTNDQTYIARLRGTSTPIRNLIFEGCKFLSGSYTAADQGYYGISLGGDGTSTGVQFVDCEITVAGTGIVILGASDFTMSGTKITAAGGYAVYLNGTSTDLTFDDCTFIGNSGFITFYHPVDYAFASSAGDIRITNSTITALGTKNAIWIYGGDASNYIGCTLYNNVIRTVSATVAVHLETNFEAANVSGNFIRSTLGGGIRLYKDQINTRIFENQIVCSGGGELIGFASDSASLAPGTVSGSVYNNLVIGYGASGYGILIGRNASDVDVYGNTVNVASAANGIGLVIKGGGAGADAIVVGSNDITGGSNAALLLKGCRGATFSSELKLTATNGGAAIKYGVEDATDPDWQVQNVTMSGVTCIVGQGSYYVWFYGYTESPDDDPIGSSVSVDGNIVYMSPTSWWGKRGASTNIPWLAGVVSEWATLGATGNDSHTVDVNKGPAVPFRYRRSILKRRSRLTGLIKE